jgi:hypothetical protein
MADELLLTAVPPGWIELKAIADDDAATAWFDALLDETPQLFDDSGRARLHECYRASRAEVAHLPVDSAGVLVTLLEGDTPTLWAFTMTQVAFPGQR